MFAHTAFKWANLAAFNAGVTVIIVGFGPTNGSVRRIFIPDEGGGAESKEVDRINGYLVPAEEIFVLKRRARCWTVTNSIAGPLLSTTATSCLKNPSRDAL